MYNSSWAEKEEAKAGPVTQVQLHIDNKIYQKIMHWVQKAPGEVSGLGKVSFEGGVYRVIDAILINQENASASTDLDPASVAKAMFELRETPGHLNFWWHSHVNMAVFWSGTDMDTIRQIGQHGFLVSTVFNKKREMRSSVYLGPDTLRPEVFLDQVPTTIVTYFLTDEMANWDREYEEKCKTRVFTYSSSFEGTRIWDNSAQQWKKWDPIAKEYEYEGDTFFKIPVQDDGPDEFDLLEDHSFAPASPPDRVVVEVTADQIEDLIEDMEAEPEAPEAEALLKKACQALRKHPLLNSDQKALLKQEYIERYNISRRLFFRSATERISQ